eukprot:TRINITY_DN4818_c0_g1_i1.p1 TRINITY_DN4818_c0_g1~~TRINITY_DN4818_c0_g1_i1.p1  ORF type:complete len:501 (-),score=104.25 TRINITY_DN4818_c0_g1_i1:38-1540(-)
MDVLNDLIKKGRQAVLREPEIVILVREATSNEGWGPTGTQMRDIAAATFNYQDYPLIMSTFWKRLNEINPRFWKHIYKSLLLLDNLLRNGSERIIDECRNRIMEIKALSEFHYIDEGKDVGLSVRERAKIIVDLLHDQKRLNDERKKASINRDKWVGMGSSSPSYFRPSSGQTEEKILSKSDELESSDEEKSKPERSNPIRKEPVAAPSITRPVSNPGTSTPTNLVDFFQPASQTAELNLFGPNAPSASAASKAIPESANFFPGFEAPSYFDPRGSVPTNPNPGVGFNFPQAPTVSDNEWNEFESFSAVTPGAPPEISPVSFSSALTPTPSSTSSGATSTQPRALSASAPTPGASNAKPETNDPWSQYSNLVDLTGLSVTDKEKKESKKIIFHNPKTNHPRTFGTTPGTTQILTPTLNPVPNPVQMNPNPYNRLPTAGYNISGQPGYPNYVNPGLLAGQRGVGVPTPNAFGATSVPQMVGNVNFNIGAQTTAVSGNNLLY